MRKKLTYIAITILVFAVAFLIGTIREMKMEAYAKDNNCTWQATGTFYGDNRDLVCVKVAK